MARVSNDALDYLRDVKTPVNAGPPTRRLALWIGASLGLRSSLTLGPLPLTDGTIPVS